MAAGQAIHGAAGLAEGDGAKLLNVEDEIVVYCSDEACVASQAAYRILESNGYKNIRRYAGGLSDWEDAGYPLEGEAV